MNTLHRTRTGQSDKSQKSNSSKDNQAIPASARNLAHHTAIDPLSGVLNHLTESQVRKLDEFKEKLGKDGWWTPEGVNGRPSHDDGTLLRFLRARKFDVSGAIGQFTDTEQWLKEQRVEELYENFDVDSYERARLLYPQWTGRRDRRGIPIYVYVIKDLDSKNVAHYQKECQKYKDSLPNHRQLKTPAKMLPLFALYHNLLNFVLPLVSTLERPNPEVPVTTSTNIVDVSGVGLAQFWNLKNHMQDASVLATAHYPETLDRIFIVGAPAFFPTVWAWIKRWFDPVTVSKIFILSKHDAHSTLSKFMDPKDIPTRYGGQLEWEWGRLPDIDEPTRAALERSGNRNWITGPCLWLDNKRVVVGSEKAKPRRSHHNFEALKPVVYAADYTEQPVHPDRKASGSGGGANGELDDPHHPHPDAVKAARVASGATAVTAATSASKPASRPTSKKEPRELPTTDAGADSITTKQTPNISTNGHPLANGTVAVPVPDPEANVASANGTPPTPETNVVPADLSKSLTLDLEKVGLGGSEKRPETQHIVTAVEN
ncbi:hypothetical protein DV736_g2001, partial [Chaetothyriales sp. CBS 134916]